MTTRWISTSALAAVAILLGAAAVEAGPKALGADEAEALIKGNTLIGFTPKDQSEFKTFYSTSGQVRALVIAKDSRKEVYGRWWVNLEGKLCNEWETFGFVDACHALGYDSETVTFIDDSGRIVSFAELKKGNPDGL